LATSDKQHAPIRGQFGKEHVMSTKERTYSVAETEARLKAELPHWYYEDGWIRRKYKTHNWKGTLMVINAVGHLAEAAWHHPDLTASYAWVEVRLQNHAAKGITDKDFELAKKNRRGRAVAAALSRRGTGGHTPSRPALRLHQIRRLMR
jgi:4a-hydroxytetrahydrobiopterin dehydratase